MALLTELGRARGVLEDLLKYQTHVVELIASLRQEVVRERGMAALRNGSELEGWLMERHRVDCTGAEHVARLVRGSPERERELPPQPAASSDDVASPIEAILLLEAESVIESASEAIAPPIFDPVFLQPDPGALPDFEVSEQPEPKLLKAAREVDPPAANPPETRVSEDEFFSLDLDAAKPAFVPPFVPTPVFGETIAKPAKNGRPPMKITCVRPGEKSPLEATTPG